MTNPQPNILNQMTRLHEPQKFNPSKKIFKNPINTLFYFQSLASTPTTATIDLSQGYSSQQINGTNQNDYSSLQPRYPIQPLMNIPRQRTPIPNSK